MSGHSHTTDDPYASEVKRAVSSDFWHTVSTSLNEHMRKHEMEQEYVSVMHEWNCIRVSSSGIPNQTRHLIESHQRKGVLDEYSYLTMATLRQADYRKSCLSPQSTAIPLVVIKQEH